MYIYVASQKEIILRGPQKVDNILKLEERFDCVSLKVTVWVGGGGGYELFL